MNRWARMLAETPPTLQRLIARTQRVSLPRGCDADERLRRLRRALCRTTTVRAVYASLDDETRAALLELCALRGGIAPDDLAARFGPLRSWSAITADPQPRSISERLVLLGWLLPRPARPRHPERFLLPPELRRALPSPLRLIDYGAAPSDAPVAPVLRAATTLLLACAAQPLRLRANGLPRRTELRWLAQRLAPSPPESASDALAFTLPLLFDLGLVVSRADRAVTTPAAARFLALPLHERLDRLRVAWERTPRSDPAIRRVMVNDRGLDWTVLRRRMLEWVAALPVGRLYDPDTLYQSLASAFGPLSDAQSHGYRRVRRTPWGPARSAAVFQAALRGPLMWLGYVQWHLASGMFFCLASPAPLPDDLLHTASLWRYGEPGIIHVPHEPTGGDMLRLLPFVDWHAADATVTSYQISPASITRAVSFGHHGGELMTLLQRMAGALPAGWSSGLSFAPTGARLLTATVVIADDPARFEQAARDRSVQRHLAERLAPGIALVAPGGSAALARALHRQGIAAAGTTEPFSAPSAGLSADVRAALALACAWYRRTAPPGAPPLPDVGIEEQLTLGLIPPVRRALDETIAALCPPAKSDVEPATDEPAIPSAVASRNLVRTIRRAIDAGRTLTIQYATPDETPIERAIRPLELTRSGEFWYLRAYCTLRNAERTFRLDRITTVQRRVIRSGRVKPERAIAEDTGFTDVNDGTGQEDRAQFGAQAVECRTADEPAD